jgi:tetratricopeptide (TPR) repeat protein
MAEATAAAATGVKSGYLGPKDLGRAESLYRSALGKPDLDYAAQLLFAALVANPEHEGAFGAILNKLPQFAANRRKMVLRSSDAPGGSPAEPFLKSLAAYCAAPRADEAMACAAEAQRAGLFPHAVALGSRVLQQLEAGDVAGLKPAAVARLIDLLEACGATDHAVRAARAAARLFPDDHGFREREKNLLASQYLKKTDLTSPARSQEMLRDPDRQAALHRPTDPAARLDELEQRFHQTGGLEDFRELVRALRESSPARREAALPVLEEGLSWFGDRETRWFVREIRLERQWAELRLHRRLLDEPDATPALRQEHDALRARALGEQIEHLYEVVSALPPGAPERQRRQLDLARRRFDARRFEEAVKQAQEVKRRPESRLDAWVVMAKSFVQLGLTPEASECFQSILAELNSASGGGSLDKVLEAKYAYAQFLVAEATQKSDPVLARQARKLCSDVMIEDIDYRDVRSLAARVDALIRGSAG